MSKPVKAPQIPRVPSIVSHYLDRANAFYRHMRRGLEALPYFDEDAVTTATHFGMPVKFTGSLGPCPDALVPVLPWGAHQHIVDC